MAIEDPHHPPVSDRRSPERRSYARRAQDRSRLARTAGAAAIAFCGGLVVLFVFFWALGAVDVTNAVAVTIVVLVLGAVWLTGFLYRRRHEQADVAERAYRDRERRGF